MKKGIIYLITSLCLIVGVTISGCGEAETSSFDEQRKVSQSDDQKGKKENNKINLKVEKYIQEAIDNAKLIASEKMFEHSNGESYVHKDMVNFPYSYYGKDKKQIQKSYKEGCLAILDNGNVYHGTTLVTDEYKVKDIVGDVDAYFITEDGKVLVYNQISYDGISNGLSYYDSYVLNDTNLEDIVA